MTDESKRKTDNILEIVPLKTRASNIENPPMAKTLGICHPFSMTICGVSGSGKSVLLGNIMLNPKLFNKYFDKIYILSPSGSCDDSLACLKIPKSQIITENFIEKLKEIIEEQKSKIENNGEDEPDLSKAEKVLIIFEDLSSQTKLMKSKEMTIIISMNRHLCLSWIALVHKYKQMVRIGRLNSNHLMIFRCSKTEIAALFEEHGTHHSKKEFELMVNDAFMPCEISDRSFFWINNKALVEKRFRKNLTHIYK